LLTFVFGFGALWCLAVAGALYQIKIANAGRCFLSGKRGQYARAGDAEGSLEPANPIPLRSSAKSSV
jgi:hypothetical protein